MTYPSAESPGFRTCPRCVRVWIVLSVMPSSDARTSHTSASTCCNISEVKLSPELSYPIQDTRQRTYFRREGSLSWETPTVLAKNGLHIHDYKLCELLWVAYAAERVAPEYSTVYLCN